jgi:RNA polymerase-binding protein DksA
MDMSQAEKFKSILLEKREELIERLDKIESSKIREEPLEADSSEQAQEIVNHEVVDALDNMEGEELDKINQALSRIDNGSFGLCMECGESISEARLKAVPFACVCINCANS